MFPIRFPMIAAASLTCLLTQSVATGQMTLRRKPPTGELVNFTHDGREREYRIHVPIAVRERKKIPLVVCLHGGGGNADQGSKMGLTAVADRHGFIALYPGAIDRHWNDGRNSTLYVEHDKHVDDAAFIIDVIERVKNDHDVDESRVFVTGVSNGGFMTQRLAIEHSETFAAAAVVIASMGKPLKARFTPKHPVSIAFLNGTADPFIPFEGGPVTVTLFPKLNQLRRTTEARRGFCIATDDAVSMWVKRNGVRAKPRVQKIADKNTEDGCHVELHLWTGGDRGTAVALYKVIGGGHTLPGGIQYLPEKVVGKTNQDIDGFEEIWGFFVKFARKGT